MVRDKELLAVRASHDHAIDLRSFGDVTADDYDRGLLPAHLEMGIPLQGKFVALIDVVKRSKRDWRKTAQLADLTPSEHICIVKVD